MSGVRLTSGALLSVAFLVIFSGAAMIAGLTFPPKAAALPLFLGVAGSALSVVQLLRELRESRRGLPDPIDLARDLPIYLWVWFFIIVVVAFGFVWSPAPLLLLYLRGRARESWWLSCAIAIGVTVMLYLLFEVLLQVELFPGLVPPMISDWMDQSS